MESKLARYIWQLIEPYHALTYFAPDAIETYERAGLKGGWMGYFAGRAGAMGPVGPEVVTATFYNFHPEMVARSIPDAWKLSSPDKALAARLEIADNAIRRLLGDDIELGDAPQLLARVAEAGIPAGRPLFAAHAALARADTPHLALWWACTAMREHRGDGHVACLVHAGLDGCEANVISAAIGALKASTQKRFRGWSDDDWAAAEDRIRARGLMDDSDAPTAAGIALKQQIEDDTDRLAALPYSVLSQVELDHLLATLERIVIPLVDKEGIHYPNPMGLTAPVRPT